MPPSSTAILFLFECTDSEHFLDRLVLSFSMHPFTQGVKRAGIAPQSWLYQTILVLQLLSFSLGFCTQGVKNHAERAGILFGALELPHSMSSIYWWTAEMSFLSKRDVLFLATLV